MGKPALPFFQQACALLQLAPEDLCMVGDDVRADVMGAQAAGIRGLLVKTGKFQPQDLAVGEPDLAPPGALGGRQQTGRMLDDDHRKARLHFSGVRVRGTRHDLAAVRGGRQARYWRGALPSMR